MDRVLIRHFEFPILVPLNNIDQLQQELRGFDCGVHGRAGSYTVSSMRIFRLSKSWRYGLQPLSYVGAPDE